MPWCDPCIAFTLIIPHQEPRTTGSLRIEPAEVKRRVDAGEKIVFVDSRNPTAWGAATNKVLGAIRVGVGEVEQKINKIPEGVLIVTYCT